MLTLEDQIVLALRRISRAMDCWSRDTLSKHGLTSPQLAILREIMAGKNVSVSTLAVALHLSQPTVSGILTRLEQRGLVSRQRLRSDRRQVHTVVTEQGRELAAKAQSLQDSLCQELQRLPVERQQQLLETLERVGSMMTSPAGGKQPCLTLESPVPS